jgi:hypothetical protein
MRNLEITDDDLLSYVVERDVDLVFLQLIQTSPRFREWFVREGSSGEALGEFMGVRHSVMRENGESDLEFGFKSDDGKNHIVLVENKIDASKQDDQVDRYFERGHDYIESDMWDEFSVCLLAPAGYVTRQDRDSFEQIVSYEETMDQFKSMNHDGSEFFEEILQEAISKRIPTDHSAITNELRQMVTDRINDLPDVHVNTTNKHLEVVPQEDDHPRPVVYNVYFPGPSEGDRAVVRIDLTRRDVSPAEIEAVKSLLLEDASTPDEFHTNNRPMDVIRNNIDRTDYSTDEEYKTAVTSTLFDLIEFYHPKLIDKDISIQEEMLNPE